MADIELRITSIELEILIRVYPEKPLAQYWAVFDKDGLTAATLTRDQVETVLGRMDQATGAIQSMADHVKAGMALKALNGLVAKLRRAMIIAVS
jgi:hypothetical protein